MKKIFVIFFCAMFGLVGCSDADTNLKGKTYQYNGPDNTKMTISFDEKENRIYGFAGVNRYFGTYQQDGQKLTFSPMGSTMMAGSPAEMRAEADFLQTLPKVTGFSLKGKTLTLTLPEGQMILTQIPNETK